jgi:3-hydroxyisobutyrate dehydrogenase-like beta-hydroxyacid dehydrogenase
MADVAVLGIGRMGAAMAERLAAAGHRLTVWNRTEATARRVVAGLPAEVAGAAAVAASPADAVRGRDVVLSMLADGDATCAVLLDTDVVAALRTDAIVCDLATSGVRAARNLAADRRRPAGARGLRATRRAGRRRGSGAGHEAGRQPGRP